MRNVHFRRDFYCAAKLYDTVTETSFDYEFVTGTAVVLDDVPDEDIIKTKTSVASGGSSSEVARYLDRGTPLMVKENGRWTVIGILTNTERYQNNQNQRRPLYFSKIYPEAFNWIVKHADSTQDSGRDPHHNSCETFTSCSCGIVGKSYRYYSYNHTIP